MSDDNFLNLGEAAWFVGVSRNTFKKKAAQFGIKPKMTFKGYRYSRSELEAIKRNGR